MCTCIYIYIYICIFIGAGRPGRAGGDREQQAAARVGQGRARYYILNTICYILYTIIMSISISISVCVSISISVLVLVLLLLLLLLLPGCRLQGHARLRIDFK